MTSEEIVKALRTCVMDPDDGGDCENCPASRSEGEYCLTVVMSEAASLIEQLTAENAALLEYAKLFTGCDTCKRRNYCKSDSECDACEQDVKGNCYCKDCERGSKWEWKGLAEAEMDALPERQRWIPVTERMPDTIICGAGTKYSEAVIVWTNRKKAMIAVWDGIDWICPVDFWDAWGEEITHWMPLPEAPEKGEKA